MYNWHNDASLQWIASAYLWACKTNWERNMWEDRERRPLPAWCIVGAGGLWWMCGCLFSFLRIHSVPYWPLLMPLCTKYATSSAQNVQNINAYGWGNLITSLDYFIAGVISDINLTGKLWNVPLRMKWESFMFLKSALSLRNKLPPESESFRSTCPVNLRLPCHFETNYFIISISEPIIER